MTGGETVLHFGVRLEDLVQPQHDLDPFVTCPRCLCLGTHHVEQGVFRARTVDVGNGDTEAITVWGDPPDGTPLVWRTCVFCSYRWRRVVT